MADPPPPAPPAEDGGAAAPRPILARRRIEDALSVLPFAALFLFATPVPDALVRAGMVFGVPAALAFLFVAWFGLILLCRHLSRRLAAPPRR